MQKRFLLLMATVMLTFSVAIFVQADQENHNSGFTLEYLHSLSDERILELHQPFREVLIRIHEAYGLGTDFACMEYGRDIFINTIYHETLESFEELVRSLVPLIKEVELYNRITDAFFLELEENLHTFTVAETYEVSEAIARLNQSDDIQYWVQVENMLKDGLSLPEISREVLSEKGKVDIEPFVSQLITRYVTVRSINTPQGVRGEIVLRQQSLVVLGHQPVWSYAGVISNRTWMEAFGGPSWRQTSFGYMTIGRYVHASAYGVRTYASGNTVNARAGLTFTMPQ